MSGSQQLLGKIQGKCNISVPGPKSDIKTPGSVCSRSYIKIRVIPDGKAGLFYLASYSKQIIFTSHLQQVQSNNLFLIKCNSCSAELSFFRSWDGQPSTFPLAFAIIGDNLELVMDFQRFSVHVPLLYSAGLSFLIAKGPIQHLVKLPERAPSGYWDNPRASRRMQSPSTSFSASFPHPPLLFIGLLKFLTWCHGSDLPNAAQKRRIFVLFFLPAQFIQQT